MFYRRNFVNAQAFWPIFRDLCREYHSDEMDFVRVNVEKHPGIRAELDIDREAGLTFVAFQKGSKVDTADGTDSRDLEKLVQKHFRAAEAVSSAGDGQGLTMSGSTVI